MTSPGKGLNFLQNQVKYVIKHPVLDYESTFLTIRERIKLDVFKLKENTSLVGNSFDGFVNRFFSKI